MVRGAFRNGGRILMIFASIVLVVAGLVLVYIFFRLAFRLWRGDTDEAAGRDSDSLRR